MTAPDPATPPRPSALRVGAVPGVTVTKWQRIWAERFPRTPLEIIDVAQADQRAVLDAGVVDLCFARLPLDADGLHAIRLYEEVPVVVAPKEHPLGALEEATLADIAGETLVPADLDDAFDRVAWGAGLLRVPLSIARSQSRRDLIHRPLTDAEPTSVVLAWRKDNPEGLIEEFIGIVRGRTVNSSRTTADRAARQQPGQATRPAGAGAARRTPRRPGRGRRRH